MGAPTTAMAATPTMEPVVVSVHRDLAEDDLSMPHSDSAAQNPPAPQCEPPRVQE